MSRIFFFFFAVLTSFIFINSCKISKNLQEHHKNSLQPIVKDNEIFNNSFSGFVLYDLKKSKEVLNINGNKFFTPASNTKIFTFYTAINILNDSMPALKYHITGDSLIILGTGNPFFLNNDLPNDTTVLSFLKQSKQKLYFSDSNYADEKYGDGWAWSDYLYSYQLDKSSFPVFGNIIKISFSQDSIYVYPEIFREKITFIADSFVVRRSFDENDFVIGNFRHGDLINVPFRADTKNIIAYLSSISGQTVYEFDRHDKRELPYKVLKQKINDSLYIRLLHNSDNFIAEQLLLMCSSELFDTLDTKRTIRYSKQKLMPYLQDSCRWVDGSGLSRYNLFLPISIVRVLIQIHDKLGLDRIKVLFPEIKLSETNNYTIKKSGAGVFAKSGSLSNNYNLSGYIITNNSNVYIFSFMNNHFLVKTETIRTEVKQTLKYIIENY